MTAARESRPAAADRLTVDLGARSYDIVVGEGVIEAAGRSLLPLLPSRRAIVVTDANVAPLYLAPLEASLARAGIRHASIILPAGEATKDFAHLEDLAGRLLAQKVERDSLLVALGGGVIGDIVGFAAAIVLRGIDFVQIPTTLLAQVDSAVGGKTGINTAAGKNLIGAFHQPRLVLSDIATLDTLPERQFLAGYAEVVKYGLVDDVALFEWLEAHGAALCGGERAARRRAVIACCAAKASIVAEDEREAGRRALLNLGHTFGHALEAETGYGEALLHGEAVAIGMVLAFELSARLGLCDSDDAGRVRRHLEARGLPVSLAAIAAPTWTADRLMAHMAQDKKVRGGQLGLVLARGIGQAFVTRDVDIAEVHAFLNDCLAA